MLNKSAFVGKRILTSSTFEFTGMKEPTFIQGVPGGMCQISGGCSLC